MPAPRTPEELDAWRAEARQGAGAYLEAHQFTLGQGGSWVGSLDVLLDDQSRRVQVDVQLPREFPDAVPIVTVLDTTIPKPMAHVVGDGHICLVQPYSVTLDTQRPEAIVRDALDRAAVILADGLTGRSEGELLNEFLAYWERGISEPAVYSLVTTTGEVNVARSVVPFRVRVTEKGSVRSYVADSESHMNEWAARRGATVTRENREALFLPLEGAVLPPDSDAGPSVSGWMEKLRAAASPKVWYQFEQWLASNSLPLLIVQSIRSQSSPVPTIALLELHQASAAQRRSLRESLGEKRRGAPSGRLTAAVELTAIGDDPIRRRICTRIDADYLTRRGGASSVATKRVVVIGCGSVGSQVAAELARAGVGKLHLVDPESLLPENAHRHVFGLVSSGRNKATALKSWLELNYPHQSVESHPTDFETLWRKTPAILAEADLVVFATGDETLERRAASIVTANPRIHVWVEPMGLGGHALGVVPSRDGTSAGCYECLFKVNDKGLLCNSASLAGPNQQFARTLAGCAGFHTPFSSLDALRSAVEASTLAVSILLGETKSSRLVTWRGPTRVFVEAGFALSRRGVMTGCLQEVVDVGDFADPLCAVCRVLAGAHSTSDTGVEASADIDQTLTP